MIRAYFLGGPEDLTKKAVEDPAPSQVTYTRPVMGWQTTSFGGMAHGVIETVRSCYRLVHTLSDGSKVYEYDPTPQVDA